jgi:hypothetical protein
MYRDWPTGDLFTSSSTYTLIASIIILVIWWGIAKDSKASTELKQFIGLGKFVFVSTYNYFLIRRLLFALAIVCVLYSLYCMSKSGQLMGMAIEGTKNYSILRELKEQYAYFVERSQYSMNISIFLIPLTVGTMWWDRHMDLLFKQALRSHEIPKPYLER